MPKYAIAFRSSESKFYHKLVELETENAALRFFFTNYVNDNYTKNEEGFNYFSEDFNDPDEPMGNILEVE